MLKIELRRAFSNKRFLFSILIGILIAIVHFIINTSKYIGVDLEQGVEYPLSLYQTYVGGDSLSMYASFLYLILPLLVALPHGGSDCFDIHQGYIYNLITRESKARYYVSKVVSTFLIGGVVAITPLVVSFMITATHVPAIIPQPGACMDAIGDSSFMGNLYFEQPLVYTLIYFGINFVFFGLLGLVALFASLFTDKVLVAIISPLLSYLSIYIVADALSTNVRYTWNPAYMLQPSQFKDTTWYILLIESVVMLGCGIYYVVNSIKKERVV